MVDAYVPGQLSSLFGTPATDVTIVETKKPKLIKKKQVGPPVVPAKNNDNNQKNNNNSTTKQNEQDKEQSFDTETKQKRKKINENTKTDIKSNFH